MRHLFDLGRPAGRLVCWLIAALAAVSALEAAPPPPAPPATTTISDVIYRADGTPTAGTLLITWALIHAADQASIS